MQNPYFGSKIKIPKNMSKSILQVIYRWSVQKTARRKTKYSRNETMLKIDHQAKGYSPCKIFTWGQKLKIQKTCQNLFYKSFTVVLCKKPLEKKLNWSRKETILKIDHHAKAIAHAKYSFSIKNQNVKKRVEIHSTSHLQMVCAKSGSKKDQIFEK